MEPSGEEREGMGKGKGKGNVLNCKTTEHTECPNIHNSGTDMLSMPLGNMLPQRTVGRFGLYLFYRGNEHHSTNHTSLAKSYHQKKVQEYSEWSNKEVVVCD